MPNQKISELTAIVTVDTSLDVLPIVDTSANTTKKISPTALKTALALDNVNNTSDANKPVSTAQQDALNAKVTGNTAIVAATKTKITYDAKGLVTAGNILDAADMPMAIDAANIGAGVVSSTEFGYLDGVTSAIQTQLNAKQATLVSATNIKTINSTSLLGSGDISISASPSGVAGAIQFSNGSAFASDATNLFWDDTNNRLGVGTNAPTRTFEVRGDALIQNVSGTDGSLKVGSNNGGINITSANRSELSLQANAFMVTRGTGMTIRTTSGEPLTAALGVIGSGSTSATTSLLVQDSTGAETFRVNDGGNFGKVLPTSTGIFYIAGSSGSTSAAFFQNGQSNFNGFRIQMNAQTLIDEAGANAFVTSSAILELKATTKGFLPPVMTTTQKNAIASPAAGLVLYDSTTNKLQCYNGSTWNDLF